MADLAVKVEGLKELRKLPEDALAESDRVPGTSRICRPMRYRLESRSQGGTSPSSASVTKAGTPVVEEIGVPFAQHDEEEPLED